MRSPATADGRGQGFGYLFPALQDRPECFLPYAADGGLDPGVQELLKALAHEIDAPSPADGESSIPAGFTYLGQFIVHDVSFDTTADVTRPIDVPTLENLRTPALDLDSLYGRGPLSQPYLYGPVESRMSSFSFRDSMVRRSYAFGRSKTASFGRMRNEFTLRNPLTRGVRAGWDVDWRRFFWTGPRPGRANVAMKIDTHVTAGLA